MFTTSDKAKVSSGYNSFLQKKEIKNSEHDHSRSGFLPPKLTFGSPNDVYEKEADAAADKVLGTLTPEPINFSPGKNIVSRKCAACEEEEKIHRKESSSDSTSAAPSIVHDVLSAGGRSMDSETRSFMELRFNYDFSNVKIHDNDLAAKSAGSINALAYTSGNNVVFNSGQYNTNSDSGKRLLAHELTHVVQRNSSKEKINSKNIIQRDLAVEPVVDAEPVDALSRRKMVGALEHNRKLHKDNELISVLRDVLGISKTPKVVDEDFVNAVVRFQATHGMVQDGRIGRIMAVYLAEELEAEGLSASATMLLKAHKLAVDLTTDACGCVSKFERHIAFDEEAARLYLACGSKDTVHNGGEVQQCVIDTLTARGVTVTVGGTTSSAGNITVRDLGTDPCMKLLQSSVFAHEWQHFMTREGLVARFGEGTTAFRSNWNNKTNWANDEARAHTINVHFMKWINQRLNSICT